MSYELELCKKLPELPHFKRDRMLNELKLPELPHYQKCIVYLKTTIKNGLNCPM